MVWYCAVLCSIVRKIVKHFASLLPKQVSAKCDNDDNSTLWYSASPHSSTIIHLLPRCWIWKRFYTLEQRYVCLLPGTTFWDSKTYLLLPRQWIWRQFYTLEQITALLLSGAAFLKPHKIFLFLKTYFSTYHFHAAGARFENDIKHKAGLALRAPLAASCAQIALTWPPKAATQAQKANSGPPATTNSWRGPDRNMNCLVLCKIV